VRQGDPLSPLLFVLAADLLQSIVNRAWHIGVLKHPIGENFGGEYPIVQYADDTLLIVPADATTLFNLKGLLRSFFDSTGLHVNFHKSFMAPINVDDQKTNHLARTFGCNVASMPFTYLGLPLGTHMPSFNEFMPLLNKMEKGWLGLVRCLVIMEGLYWSTQFFLQCLPFTCVPSPCLLKWSSK